MLFHRRIQNRLDVGQAFVPGPVGNPHAAARTRARCAWLPSLLLASTLLVLHSGYAPRALAADDAWDTPGLGKDYTLEDLVPGHGLPGSPSFEPGEPGEPGELGEPSGQPAAGGAGSYAGSYRESDEVPAFPPTSHGLRRSRINDEPGSQPGGSDPGVYGPGTGADESGIGTYRPLGRYSDSYGAPRPPYPSSPPLPPAASVPPNQPLPENYQPWYAQPDGNRYDDYEALPSEQAERYDRGEDYDYDPDLDYEDDW